MVVPPSILSHPGIITSTVFVEPALLNPLLLFPNSIFLPSRVHRILLALNLTWLLPWRLQLLDVFPPTAYLEQNRYPEGYTYHCSIDFSSDYAAWKNDCFWNEFVFWLSGPVALLMSVRVLWGQSQRDAISDWNVAIQRRGEKSCPQQLQSLAIFHGEFVDIPQTTTSLMAMFEGSGYPLVSLRKDGDHAASCSGFFSCAGDTREFRGRPQFTLSITSPEIEPSLDNEADQC